MALAEQVASLGSFSVAEEEAIALRASPCRGETAATRYGRLVHKEWDYGPGFKPEFTFKENGKVLARVDAINFETRVIKELKPFTDSSVGAGLRQLERYRLLAERLYGGKWATVLEAYPK